MPQRIPLGERDVAARLNAPEHDANDENEIADTDDDGSEYHAVVKEEGDESSDHERKTDSDDGDGHTNALIVTGR
jgi:hypothetical protein